jgi:hypothetical protein
LGREGLFYPALGGIVRNALRTFFRAVVSLENTPEAHICEWEGCDEQSVCGVNGAWWCSEHMGEGMRKSLPAVAAFKEIFDGT